MIGHDDVGLHRDFPAFRREAVGAVCALRLTDTFAPGDRESPPHARVDGFAELVAITGGGFHGPGAHGRRLFAELGPRDDRVAVVFRLLAMQALEADVVVPSFEHGVAEGARQQRFECLGDDGQVALGKLALQREGCGRDHDGVALHRMQGRRDEIGQGLARARAGLDEQVAGHLTPGVQGLRDRLGHGQLPRAGFAAQRLSSRGEGLLDTRQVRSTHGRSASHGSGPSASVGTCTPSRAARSGRTRARRRVPSGRCSCDSTSPSACAAATRSPRS